MNDKTFWRTANLIYPTLATITLLSGIAAPVLRYANNQYWVIALGMFAAAAIALVITGLLLGFKN